MAVLTGCCRCCILIDTRHSISTCCHGSALYYYPFSQELSTEVYSKRITAGKYAKLIKQNPSVISTKRRKVDIAKTAINKEILMADLTELTLERETRHENKQCYIKLPRRPCYLTSKY